MLRLIAKNPLFITWISCIHLVYINTQLNYSSSTLNFLRPSSFLWNGNSTQLVSAQSLVAILSTLFSQYQCKFHLQILCIFSTKWLELPLLFPLPLTRISHHHLPSWLFPLALTISNLFLTKKIGGMLLRI